MESGQDFGVFKQSFIYSPVPTHIQPCGPAHSQTCCTNRTRTHHAGWFSSSVLAFEATKTRPGLRGTFTPLFGSSRLGNHSATWYSLPKQGIAVRQRDHRAYYHQTPFPRRIAKKKKKKKNSSLKHKNKKKKKIQIKKKPNPKKKKNKKKKILKKIPRFLFYFF